MIRNAGSILIIEDDQLVALSYRDFLEARGFICHLAPTLREACTCLRNQAYDLIFCDHDLPDGKGIQLLHKLQKQGQDTPVYYLSAAPQRIIQQAGQFPFVRDILQKPVEKIDLELICSQLIQKGDLLKSNNPHQQRLISLSERKALMELFNSQADNLPLPPFEENAQ